MNDKINMSVIKITATGCNMHSGTMTYGMIQPITVYGFLHALQRKLSLEMDSSFMIDRFIPVTHEFESNLIKKSFNEYLVLLKKDSTVRPHYRSTECGGTNSSLPEITSDIEMSIILDVSCDDPNWYENIELIRKKLLSLKFAGGDILDASFEYFEGITENDLKRKIYKGVGKTQVISDRTDLLEDSSNKLRTVIDNVSQFNVLNKETRKWTMERAGSFSTICIGYYGLSEPSTVKNSRSQYKSTFVEPVYTICEYGNVYKYELEDLFWEYSIINDNGNNFYFVKQRG